MPRWIRIALRIIGIFLILVVIGWMAIAAYVHTHKKQLLESITAQLNEDLAGTLTIEKMEPELIRGFPGISVSLSNVVLRDSLWNNHRHDVLNAKEAYISVDAFSILGSTPTIRNIKITNGNLYFYTDSLGYSNTDLFKKRTSTDQAAEGNRKKINRIDLANVKLVIENQLKANLFDFNIARYTGKIRYNNDGWKARANLNTLVNSLIFNTKRGSFIKNKTFEADIEFSFNKENQLLTIPIQDMKIGNSDFEIGGKFSLADNSSAFALDIKAPRINLKDASSLFTPNITSRLSGYTLKDPLSANASIRGNLKGGIDPNIKANWQVKNNTLVANGETITDCNFTGRFTNEIINKEGTNDKNSALGLYNMTGSWRGIPFRADSITLTNLKAPVMAGTFLADFPLKKLNAVFGGQTFSFGTGTAHLNLLYKAPYFSKDQSQRYINGNVQIKNASLNYLPRNLPFKNVQARINFSGQDLFLRDINVQSGGSSLQMEGTIRNFLNLFYTDPTKMLLDWHIKSPQINLGQFLSFLGQRQSSKPGTGTMNRFSRQLDRMLNEASVQMQMQVDKVIYKKFVAHQVKSNLTLKQQGISINNISLSHAGGSLQMNGNIDQKGKLNQVQLNTSIRNANIQQLFYAFNNFGQSGITDQNLRGTFNADTRVSGTMRDNGDMVPRSIRGTIDFTLKNGALINFEPMERIGSFAFANRDFKNITFKNLSNRLTLNGNTVNIPPMKIESSVLNIYLEGVYGFSWGTNIAMQVPLRNPKKDEFVFDKAEREERAKRGIVINLHAVDGENGKVKIKLGKDKTL
ncbi:MAG TPA: AsmA-like C-terminal region-containing protein [Daejeonella sp.]|nr:AsmA-like C-terminal region-containing protein [Daejeonella sp.]